MPSFPSGTHLTLNTPPTLRDVLTVVCWKSKWVAVRLLTSSPPAEVLWPTDITATSPPRRTIRWVDNPLGPAVPAGGRRSPSICPPSPPARTFSCAGIALPTAETAWPCPVGLWIQFQSRTPLPHAFRCSPTLPSASRLRLDRCNRDKIWFTRSASPTLARSPPPMWCSPTPCRSTPHLSP